MKKFKRNFLIQCTNQTLKLFVVILLIAVNIDAQNSTVINLDSTHQIIRGFGAANIVGWRPDMTQSEINTAFGTGDGQLGFSILRLRVPPDQNSFSINLPSAQAAHSMGVTLIAAPWSPPASMKTNNNLVGGELKESSYADFAAYLKSFADYMASNNAPIYAVSVQNEPDISVTYESCDYNADQMLKFVKENGNAVGTKLMAPESFQFRKNISDPLLSDSTALANFDIICGHIYGGGLASYPLAEEKGKEVWMTEHLTESAHSANIWSLAMDVALEMQQVMNAKMSAYIWWYIVRYYGPIGDGEQSATFPNENFSAKGEITKKGYVMSQFARFIRPGFYRVESKFSPQRNVYTTAYKDSSSSKVIIVAINTSSQPLTQSFVLENGSADMFVPYVTSKSKNCVREDSILVSGGSFAATLDASSITTFVSEINTVSVNEPSVIPNSYKLLQNYPNPFNPTSTISFSLPERSFVSLKLINVLGKEVMNITEGSFNAGLHNILLDATDLSSGVYFYRLVTNNFSDTKKLILLK